MQEYSTAREILTFREKGDVRNQLGLPEFAIDLDIPGEIAACMNSALDRAGYDDRDIFLDVESNLMLDYLKYRSMDMTEYN